jgi:dephospho-CoA kinase
MENGAPPDEYNSLTASLAAARIKTSPVRRPAFVFESLMIAIGLTGGIASGKSLVSAMLAEKGVPVIEADRVGHESYRQGSEARRRVVKAFGPEVVGPDGEIDRRALGARVFGDAEARQRLGAIVWPAMRGMMEERLAGLRDEDVSVAVLEAAVLIEADWLPLVDEVWVVTVPGEVARQRLMSRNGLTADQADARISAQLRNEDRTRYADVVIDNSGSLEALREQVDRAWARLEARLGASEAVRGD